MLFNRVGSFSMIKSCRIFNRVVSTHGIVVERVVNGGVMVVKGWHFPYGLLSSLVVKVHSVLFVAPAPPPALLQQTRWKVVLVEGNRNPR